MAFLIEKWIQTPKPCTHCEVIDYCIATNEICEGIGINKLRIKKTKMLHAYLYYPLLMIKKRRF